MRAKYCDKCGRVINDNPWTQAVLPMYKITKFAGLMEGGNIEVDLCGECSRGFDQWLHEKPEDTKDPA